MCDRVIPLLLGAERALIEALEALHAADEDRLVVTTAYLLLTDVLDGVMVRYEAPAGRSSVGGGASQAAGVQR